MDIMMTTKPMFNSNLVAMSYCFQYMIPEYDKDSSVDASPGVLQSCIEIINSVGLESLTSKTPAFIPVSINKLTNELADLLKADPSCIVFHITEAGEFNDGIKEEMSELVGKGYRFAINLDNCVNTEITGLCHFWCLSFSNSDIDYDALRKIVIKNMNKSFVAFDVDDIFVFEMLKDVGVHLFVGKFSNIPILKDDSNLSPLKVNQIQLMNAVMKAEDNFQFKEISDIISRDMHLSVSVLKYINTPYWGMRHKVKDIHQAVVYIGIKEAKRWVSTTISTLLGQDKPDEITRTSLLRARLSESLAPLTGHKKEAQELFLMGLFSTLDIVLEMPMNRALELVSVSDDIVEALVFTDGVFGDVYRLVQAYEYAEWDTVTELLEKFNISYDAISRAYVDALRWYNAIMHQPLESK